MSDALRRCVEIWREIRGELSVCNGALDRVVDAHPSLPAIQMRLQSVRALVRDLAEQLTVLRDEGC